MQLLSVQRRCGHAGQVDWVCVCAYMSRLPGADMDLSSLLLGHSKGLLKERFLSMAFTKIWKVHNQKDVYHWELFWAGACAQKVEGFQRNVTVRRVCRGWSKTEHLRSHGGINKLFLCQELQNWCIEKKGKPPWQPRVYNALCILIRWWFVQKLPWKKYLF